MTAEREGQALDDQVGGYHYKAMTIPHPVLDRAWVAWLRLKDEGG